MNKLIFSTLLVSISITLVSHALNSSDGISTSQPAKTKQFDFYLLATQWIPGWCVVGSGQSGAILDSSRACQLQISQPLMYHGLWPEKQDGSYPVNCGQVAPLDKLQLKFANPFSDYLINSEVFLDHEWRKHGTCSNAYTEHLEISNPQQYYAQVNNYFKSSIGMYQKIKLPTLALELPASELVKQIHGLNPQIVASSVLVICEQDKSKQNYLTGLWFCINKARSQYMSCPQAATKLACKGTVITR